MTKTITRKKHEVIVNDAPTLLATFEPGDCAHQGDLIIVCISKLPAGAKPRTNRQLAEGTTQGSRHILERGEVYDAPKAELRRLVKEATGAEIADEYLGPVFVSPEASTCDDLSHPEHGNQGFPAGAVCAVVYQRNRDAEEREARVRD